MAPLLANEMLQGKGFVDVVHKELMGVGLNVDAYNITTVSPSFDHSLLWKDGVDDTLIFTFSGFDVNGTLEGNVTGLPGQKCTLQALNIVNISVQIEVAAPQTSAKDGVHWQIVGRPQLHLGAVELKVKQFTWQIALNKVLPLLVSGINYGLAFADGVVEGMVWNFNQKLASAQPELLVNVMPNINLNLTTPRAPSLSSDTDLIEVWLDGRFVSDVAEVSTEAINSVEPVRNTEHKQFDQIFIHQSMLDSALDMFYGAPITQDASPDIKAQLLQIFYELEDYYGKDLEMKIQVGFEKKDGQAVQFSPEHGIEIGNIPEGGLNTNLVIFCKNATTNDAEEKAFELNLDVKANVNASFESFVVYGAVNDVVISNTKVVADNVGLDFHAYDDLFTSIAKSFADTFNLSHASGIDLTKKFSTLQFIAGMAQNSIVTPLKQDEFLYAGFKWISDW